MADTVVRWKRMHVVNYILRRSGIREYCSKCAGCCFVCSSHKDYKYGCRNEQCLMHICSDLAYVLRQTKRGDRLLLLLHDIMQRDEINIKEAKQQVDALSNTVPLCRRIYNKRSLGLKNMAKRRDPHRINLELVERAKEFDKITDELFA